MGGAVEPLDTNAMGSVVRYGLVANSLVHEAIGDLLVYVVLGVQHDPRVRHGR